jgi:hypothetical protein
LEVRAAADQERRQAAQVAADVGATVDEALMLYRGMRSALAHLQDCLGREPTEAEQLAAMAAHFDIPERELRLRVAKHRGERIASEGSPGG